MKKGIVYTLVFTLAVSFVFVFVLAAVNEYTRPLAERNIEVAKRTGVLRAFGIGFEGDEDAFARYESLIARETIGDTVVYVYRPGDAASHAARPVGGAVAAAEDASGGDAIGTPQDAAPPDDRESVLYAVLFEGRGLWGTIRGAISVNADASRIAGLEIVEHSETPGLCGRIDEPAYKEQFAGELLGPDGKLRLARTGTYDTNHDDGSVDGVTGATRTSEAVNAIVIAEVAKLKTLIGELNGRK